jgi:D-alanyl-D-alanine carboxypeptidase
MSWAKTKEREVGVRQSWSALIGRAGLAILMAAGPAWAAEAGGDAWDHTAEGSLPAADIAFIDSVVKQQMAAENMPGVTVSIVAPGKGTFLRSYGVADIESGRELQPDDHYRIGSVTKTFTATAILQLVDRHKLRLSDTLSMYVDGVPNGDIITIEQLLGMRAGIFDWVDDPKFWAAYTADPLLPGWQPTDIIPILQKNERKFTTPGVQTVYSNSNYVLLGLVIEKVTGQKAERYINRHVIQRLELHDTVFPVTPDLPEPFSRGYDTSVGPVRDVTFSSVAVPWTAGAMVSTIPDMTRYAKALATGRSLLSRRMQRKRLTFNQLAGTERAPVFAGYGLGIMEVGDWVGHDGSIFGYSDFVFHLPSARATIVVMVNRAGSTDVPATATWFAIAQHLYPDSFPPP